MEPAAAAAAARHPVLAARLCDEAAPLPQVHILPTGATLQRVLVPDGDTGGMVDVVLGFDDVEAYKVRLPLFPSPASQISVHTWRMAQAPNPASPSPATLSQNGSNPQIGSTLGRVGGRIAGAEFEINGVTYHTSKNADNDTMHGG